MNFVRAREDIANRERGETRPSGAAAVRVTAARFRLNQGHGGQVRAVLGQRGSVETRDHGEVHCDGYDGEGENGRGCSGLGQVFHGEDCLSDFAA